MAFIFPAYRDQASAGYVPCMLFLFHSANYGSDKKKENHSHYKNNTEALLDKLLSKTKEKKCE